MNYLESITFPDADAEWAFRMGIRRTCYNTMYPFGVLSAAGLERMDFAPVTMLCGGNGCGKTTVLNVIAEKFSLERCAPYNRSSFFEDYVSMCTARVSFPIPSTSRIVTSDDVFEYTLDVRRLNEGIDQKREELFTEHTDSRHSVFQLRSLEDYDELRRRNNARRKTQSAFVKEELAQNTREQSNGESALFYFRERIDADALYLLDEPENSLSPKKQEELADFIRESARYFDCQFIISTHSPFLLSLSGAKIYDMDARPVTVRPWTELPHVRAYRDFFAQHAREFSPEE